MRMGLGVLLLKLVKNGTTHKQGEARYRGPVDTYQFLTWPDSALVWALGILLSAVCCLSPLVRERP